jgi:hypothetical protein
MSTKILQHTGLGDYIICYALIKELVKNTNKNFILLIEKQYMSQVQWMYRDIYNISFESIEFTPMTTMHPNILSNIKIGYAYLEKFYNTTSHFDQIFYEQFQYDFSNRWNKFTIPRDINAENELYDLFKLQNKKYIFLHETEKYKIDRKHITPMDIISPIPGLTNNIFDYCKIIENANEIHCIDSSFKNLADSLTPTTHNLFYYKNRHINNFYYSSCKLNWNIIEQNKSFIQSITSEGSVNR